jgi:hypothetical protein
VGLGRGERKSGEKEGRGGGASGEGSNGAASFDDFDVFARPFPRLQDYPNLSSLCSPLSSPPRAFLAPAGTKLSKALLLHSHSCTDFSIALPAAQA